MRSLASATFASCCSPQHTAPEGRNGGNAGSEDWGEVSANVVYIRHCGCGRLGSHDQPANYPENRVHFSMSEAVSELLLGAAAKSHLLTTSHDLGDGD